MNEDAFYPAQEEKNAFKAQKTKPVFFSSSVFTFAVMFFFVAASVAVNAFFTNSLLNAKLAAFKKELNVPSVTLEPSIPLPTLKAKGPSPTYLPKKQPTPMPGPKKPLLAGHKRFTINNWGFSMQIPNEWVAFYCRSGVKNEIEGNYVRETGESVLISTERSKYETAVCDNTVRLNFNDLGTSNQSNYDSDVTSLTGDGSKLPRKIVKETISGIEFTKFFINWCEGLKENEFNNQCMPMAGGNNFLYIKHANPQRITDTTVESPLYIVIYDYFPETTDPLLKTVEFF